MTQIQVYTKAQVDAGFQPLNGNLIALAAAVDPVILLRTSVTLTDAQIKALPGGVAQEKLTTIVAAPGANKVIRVVSVDIRTVFAAGAYTNVAANGAWEIAVGDDLNSWRSAGITLRNNLSGMPLASFLGAANQLTQLTPAASVAEVGTSDFFVLSPAFGATAEYTNEPLSLYVFNADGDYADGNAANEMIITSVYYLLDV